LIEDLLERARAGDSEALMSLLHQAEPELRRFVSRETHASYQSLFETDDVLQVTYFEAFLRIGQFAPNGPDSFLNWLIRIARNNLLDAVRRQQRKKRIPLGKHRQTANDGSTLDRLLELAGSQTSPSRTAATEEAGLLLKDALGQLPEDYATVIRLTDLENRPVSEVAATMNRGVGAIWMLRARAHDRLAELMGTSSKFFLDGR